MNLYNFYGSEKYKHKKSLEFLQGFKSGWLTGFEPATRGTTNRYSNQLSYNHHFCLASANIEQRLSSTKKKMKNFHKNYIKFSKLLTAKHLSTVKPSAKSTPTSLPKSCAR